VHYPNTPAGLVLVFIIDLHFIGVIILGKKEKKLEWVKKKNISTRTCISIHILHSHTTFASDIYTIENTSKDI